MTKAERKVIEECAHATRVHEKTIYDASFWHPEMGHVADDVVEGLAITATKLENLLKEGK